MLKPKLIAFGFLLAVAIFGCSYDFPTEVQVSEIDPGEANFDNFMIIGGSMPAGFMDGALYTEGQNLAYPALVSKKIEEATGTQFYVTLSIDSENGYNFELEESTGEEGGRYELIFRDTEDNYPARIPTTGASLSPFTGSLNEVNNFSIPGLRISEVDSVNALDGNPYFDRLNSMPQDHSLLDIVLQNEPSLLLLQLGTDRMFNYVMAGASGEENPAPGSILENDLTPASLFEERLISIINRILSETESEIILSTIPNPLELPYLNSIPWYFTVNETEQILQKDLSYLSQFNRDVQQYNQNADYADRRPVITFDVLGDESFRGLIIEDEYLVDAQNEEGETIPKWRQLRSGDYLLYSAEEIHFESLNSDLAFGTTTPVENKYVLTVTEQEIIKTKINEFNEIIKESADMSPKVKVMDIEQLLIDVAEEEIFFDGVNFTLEFGPDGIISADGYSLNPKGQALITNALIELINKDLDTPIPLLDVNSFRGTVFRNGF